MSRKKRKQEMLRPRRKSKYLKDDQWGSLRKVNGCGVKKHNLCPHKR